MKTRRIALLFLIVILGIVPLALLWGQTAASGTSPTPHSVPTAQIDPALREAMETAAPNADIRFIIHLRAQADLRQQSLPAAELTRRNEIVRRLQETAASSQGALRQNLNQLQQHGLVSAMRPLWIVNAIAVTGATETITELAAFPGVARLSLDDSFPVTPTFPVLEQLPVSGRTAGAATAWGVRRVRAPHVWHGLGISGTGVTVAIFDSGVDWLHPDLFPNYRGNLGNGQVDHRGNWYHAAIPSISTPVDSFGHGTHVAGTAVGQNGIGVAPGASWMAVAISDDRGLIFASSIHAGYQWLLAPDGNPALSPDIINNSWGNPQGWRTDYYTDVQILKAAGIIPVYSTGNTGPMTGTIGAPASYTGTIAVGASDDIDSLAWFSSRGPSPLNEEVKPALVAPGTAILSAFPQNSYLRANGTSMAAPHVTGGIALLLQANPGLSEARVMQVLMGTAVPISTTHPNPGSGWGRLDVYRAVASRVSTGEIAGTIRVDGMPLPGATVVLTTPSGVTLTFTTNADGSYQAVLAPGTYSLSVSSFGTTGARADGLIVVASSTRLQDFSLSSLPGGTVAGRARSATSGAPLPDATVTVVNTPVTADTDENGRYLLALPAGTYVVRIDKNGYRSQMVTVILGAGDALQNNFTLAAAPTTLLVDSGQWYYDSQIAYFEQTLQEVGRGYDKWTIRHAYADRPTAADLTRYDQVVWSDPYAAPGVLAMNNVITGYLDAGGHLLISGNNIGRVDGTGFGTQYWWYDYLRAQFTGEFPVPSTAVVQGNEGTPFAGLSLQLNGGDSAGNQQSPDEVQPQPQALTTPILSYPSGEPAALLATHCRDYRIVFLGFGLEGVAGSQQRASLLQSSFNAFAVPLITSGARWLQPDIEEIVVAGSSHSYDFSIQNLSETVTDTFDLSVSGPGWPTNLITDTLRLGPCATGGTTLQLIVPPGTPDDTEADFVITAVSRLDPAIVVTRQIRHKTPGDILVVDGDRFYEHESGYEEGLAAMGVKYDLWDVGGSETKAAQGSPPEQLLPEYDMVVWFTGNDWYQPVSANDRQTLRDYLASGGRLFLISQDFLSYDIPFPLQQQLGLLSYQTDVTPTLAFGAGTPYVSPEIAQPLTITYGTRRNQGDGLIPTAESEPFLWHDAGMVAGTMTAASSWRTVFMALPLQMLPADNRAIVVNDGLGWISDLGDSTITAAFRSAPLGAPFTYSINIRNWESAPQNVISVSNVLPASLELVPGTLSGDAVFDPVARTISWQGALPGGAHHQIQYRAVATADLAPGTRLDNEVVFRYARHGLRMVRTATVWIDAPELSPSELVAAVVAQPRQTPGPQEYLVRYSALLRNRGAVPAPTASARLFFPRAFYPLSGSLQASTGTATVDGHQLSWSGTVAPGGFVTISLSFTHTAGLDQDWFSAVTFIDDGVTDPLVRGALLHLQPHTHYFPLIAKPQ